MVFVAIRLPDGASQERTMAVSDEIERLLLSTPGIEAATTLGGVDRLTQTNNSNVATVIGLLKPWEERGALTQQAIIRSLQPHFAKERNAIVFAFGQPPILGLGASGGFEFMIQDRSDAGVARFERGDSRRSSPPPASGRRSPASAPASGRRCRNTGSISTPTRRRRSACRSPMSTRRCRPSWAACT